MRLTDDYSMISARREQKPSCWIPYAPNDIGMQRRRITSGKKKERRRNRLRRFRIRLTWGREVGGRLETVLPDCKLEQSVHEQLGLTNTHSSTSDYDPALRWLVSAAGTPCLVTFDQWRQKMIEKLAYALHKTMRPVSMWRQGLRQRVCDWYARNLVGENFSIAFGFGYGKLQCMPNFMESIYILHARFSAQHLVLD